MKKFKRALIVGKFSPVHNGHVNLIQYAIEQSEEVIIFSYSNPEFIDSNYRDKWLSLLFPQAKIFIFTAENSSYPLNSESDITHRKFVANMYLDKISMPLDAIFAGEDYLYSFTLHMSDFLKRMKIQSYDVVPVLFDRNKQKDKISATMIRTEVHKYRNFLPSIVYSDFIKRICFLGAESTGKSTLAQLLAKSFKTSYVEEFGRTLWEKKAGNLVFEDMLLIATEHIKNENTALLQSNKYLFIDTSPLTTLFYSESYFQKSDSKLIDLSYREYDFIFLCAPDFPFVQDGTRADQEFRIKQHQWYLEQLELRKTKYTHLFGKIEERVEKVINILELNF
jgi:HTH-type transcriptional repressor of NAD biosynthesis genes